MTSQSIRQDIRDRFNQVKFPQPTIEPLFYGKREKVLCPKTKAVVDYDTGDVLSLCSNKYVLVHHEDILHQAILETEILDKTFGEPTINVQMMNNGARMLYNICWTNHAFDVKAGDPVVPLFRGFNSYDSSLKIGSEYGAMRLVCTNGMVVGEVDSSSSRRHLGDVSAQWVRNHIFAGVTAFTETTAFLGYLAQKMIKSQDYEILWAELPFTQKEREKIEALPLLGFDGDTLQSHSLSGQVSAWMVQAALTQYNTHEMRSPNRSVEIAPKIGQVMNRFARSVGA